MGHSIFYRSNTNSDQNQTITVKTRQQSLEEDIVDALPSLRNFARSLTRNGANAEDLVQETMLKALTNFDKFADGTNIRAWLFTIMRNTFYSDLRKTRREVSYIDCEASGMLSVNPPQENATAVNELAIVLRGLPDLQHQALLLVAVSGLSYEEAAQVSGCALGTMKSRVNRARCRLQEIMTMNG